MKRKVMVLTAQDSLKVFRMTSDRIEAAIERHPYLTEIADFRITLTSTSYENSPGWNDRDFEIFYRDVADADVLIGYMFPTDGLRPTPMTRPRAPRLEWIHIIGAGVEHLHPLDWLGGDLKLTNNRGAHAPKTCEYSMMAMLMLGNHMPRLATAQRKAHWDGHFVSVVEGGTVLVVGAGKQGSAVADAARKLGIRTIGVDPNVSGKTGKEGFELIAPPSQLHTLLPQADYVFLTLPSLPETHRFFGEKEFSAMKEGAGFVNISRGKVLDIEAMAGALRSGKISGAILDVFEEEPLPQNSPLWNTPNLVITPHMGCDDEENYIHRTFDIVAENLRKLDAGQELENLIDPARGY